jgi:hypothetical protein
VPKNAGKQDESVVKDESSRDRRETGTSKDREDGSDKAWYFKVN